MRYSKIVGLGHYVPEKIITNEYLSTVMDTNNEWIVERTGIETRRWIDADKDTAANMAAKATHMALERAKLSEKDIDFALKIWPGGTVDVRENGAYKYFETSYGAGDKWRISVAGGVVTFSKNGTVFYRSSRTAAGALAVDTAFSSTGAKLADIVLSGAK